MKKQKRLSKEQKDFFKEALDKDGNVSKVTPEGKAVLEMVNLFKQIKADVIRSIGKHQNEAQHVKWLEENNIKWLEDGTYATQTLSREFLEEVNFSEVKLKENLRKRTDEIAYNIVRTKYKNNPNIDEAFLKKISQDNDVQSEAKIQALEQYYAASNHTQAKMSSRFLKSRSRQRMPEYWKTADGKEVKVFDDSYDAFLRYVMGMAKFTSTIEFLPEYAKIPGFKIRGFQADLQELSRKKGGHKVKQYLEKQIEQRIGMSKKESTLTLI